MNRVIRNVIRKYDGSRFDGSEIHLRQGDLDGACGPYCLVMALIGLELISREKVMRGFYHGNSRVAKLIRTLESNNGDYFFKNGTKKENLKEAILASFSRDVDVDYLDENVKGRDFRDFVDSCVNNGKPVRPVILGISFGKNTPWAHWVLIVGHELSENGMSRYLILDPGTDKPRSGECWNAKIEANGSGSPLPYLITPNQGKSYRVSLIDAVSFLPK